ncbi:MAG: DegT/DnrJ/EryC1/StrS family aminotransferase [Pseudomonadota bacterium]|nr:DegT/DnrJ/EryC1/StrS family aminotransferase [Pseudomonadota bacterium]
MINLSRPNISEQAIESVARVLRSGQLVHGPESETFEQELAAYLGCQEAVLVSSGTAALHLALMALDIGPGDAVLVPDFTFPATANAVMAVGALPVLVDVSADTYNLDPQSLRQAIEGWRGAERLRAVMPVHEFGHPADMTAINGIAEEHGLYVVEDAACALGANLNGRKTGTFGDLACFSFHPRKTLTTGEGGLLTTDNQELAQRARRLRNHGMERTDTGMRFMEPSLNYRLTNFQAALGRAQLPSLDGWITDRRELAALYMENLTALAGEGLLALPNADPGHSWQTFMVVLNGRFDRAEVMAKLKAAGIESNLGAQSMQEIGLYGPALDTCKVGPQLYAQGLALPLYERMTPDHIRQVAEGLRAVLSGAD